MDKKKADELLRQTKENYDNIARSFADSRRYPWPDFISLLKSYVKPGQKVLDIGCGNARYYQFFKENGNVYVGVDNSEKLVEIARKEHPEGSFKVAEGLDLPFPKNEFDAVVSIATIHHVPSREYREKFVKEAARILKPGGILILSAWNLSLAKMIRLRVWKRLWLFLKTQAMIAMGRQNLDFGDFYITWQNKYQRFVHVFSIEELEGLAKKAGLIIEISGVSELKSLESNLYIIAKKV